MILLYFFLPSPAIPPHKREAYIQNKLASGNTAITSLDFAPFREESRDICYDCTNLLIHWRLVNCGRHVSLHFSDYSKEYGSVNMTKALELARDWNQERWSSQSEQKWTPYFSVPMTMDGIPGGSLGEEIAMPWFHAVDQKLIDYNMHNAQSSVFVRAVVPEPGIVQIWRSRYVDWALNATAESAGLHDDASPTKAPEQVSYEEMMLYKQETDFLASFHLVESWENMLVVMEHLAGELPSRTYTIRRALLVFLGPFIAIPFIMANELYEFMSPFAWFVVVWVGLIIAVVFYPKMLESGNLSSFGRLCWPLRIFKRRRNHHSERKQVWGPTGPVDMGKERSLFDEESEISLRRPDTVQLQNK
jgi:hypothetical protein